MSAGSLLDFVFSCEAQLLAVVGPFKLQALSVMESR
jgi:hypothetical protein